MKDYLALNEDARDELRRQGADALNEARARAYETLTLALSDPADVAPDLANGSKDTATVACRDVHHHPVTGEVCGLSFLHCLMCSNAVAMPRHLPRLALLHTALTDGRSAMTAPAWARWQDHYLRLEAFLLVEARLSEGQIREVAATGSATDARDVRALLDGTYDPA